jgi:methionine synthase II (cobalamin-independent)
VKHLTAIPFWPQLPQRSFLEGMAAQFTEGLPNVVIDEPNKKIWIDTTDIETALTDFYQHYLDNDVDYFAVSLERAVGFYGMLHRLQKDSGKLQYVKGQVTGPITFGAMLTDKEGVALMHHPALAEALNKCLIMKARWQIDAFKKLNLKSIIFLDEPYLMGYGSAYVPLTKETVISRLTEVIEEVHKDGALVGIHCCGNTDWSVLLATPVDILNFDGYGFMDKLMLYTDDLKRFIERGGVIAWGVVPSIELDKPVTAEEIITKLDQGVNTLAKKGIDPAQIAAQSILTPSCGLGALSPDEAEKRLQLLVDVASEYGRKHLR